MGSDRSLTDPPKNLKEAIDWLALVGDAYGPNNWIWGKYVELERALKGLPNYNEATESKFGVASPQGLIRFLAQYLGFGFLGYSAQAIDTFGGSGIIDAGSGGYASTYANSDWPSGGGEKECAKMFLGIATFVYYCLSYLYYQCKDNRRWGQSSLTGDYNDPLKHFMTNMGFNGVKLRNITGSTVAAILDKAFSEFTQAYSSSSYYPSYSDFLGQLEQKVPKGALGAPLTSCFILSNVYCQYHKVLRKEAENPLPKIKETLEQLRESCGLSDSALKSQISTFISNYITIHPFSQEGDPSNSPSPAPAVPVAGTLTTFGLGGGAAAAYLLDIGGAKTLVNGLLMIEGAIDWILRVTEKDGGIGGSDNGATEALAKQVKELLNEVTKSHTELGVEITKLTETLGNGDIIAKLADGMQQFIGYKENGNTKGFITGAGIAPSNIATHRLCDATIAFTIGVLESLSKDSSIKDNTGNKEKVDSVINKLSQCYGNGPGGFAGVAKEVEKLQVQATGRGTNISDINKLVKAVKDNFKSQLKVANGRRSDIHQNVGQYLKQVFQAGNGSADVTSQLQQLMTQGRSNKETYDATKLDSEINNVKTQLRTGSQGFARNVLDAGKKAFISHLKKENYESRYKGVSIDNIKASTYAKIFLSCLPLIFNNLSYFYWQCRDGGAWHNQNLTGGSLSPFMQGHWFFNSNMNENMTGTSVIRNVMDDKFKELQTAAQAVPQKSYSDFLKEFRSKGQQNWKGASVPPSPVSNTNYLSGLYILCTSYFQCQQIKSAEKASRSPQTIREMLYFLAALQFSPQYDAFDRYVTSHFRTLLGKQSEDSTDDSELKLEVADSGTSATGNTLSAANLKSYLLSTAIFIPGALGVIQDQSASDKSEPWLHSLFSNSQFKLSIPSSGPGIFSALSNYAYALQFQLSFLYIQCRNTYTKACGWNQCSYGSDIKIDGVMSHICPTRCNRHQDDKHTDLKDCKHEGCGTSGKPSPLQAFLTDNLKDFSRGHPSDPSSHLASCSGQMCHVPMGFNPNDLRASSNANLQGSHIAYALGSFCGGFNTPLRQLSEKLGCLTKRTPRTLGDLFGFIWHLNGQLFKTERPTLIELSKKLINATGDKPKNVPKFLLDLLMIKAAQPSLSDTSPTGLSLSLSAMAPAIPFLYQLFMGDSKNFLPMTLFDLKGTTHKGLSIHSANLFSLYNPECTTPPNNNCGPYLYPLTHSDGATYAPKHASAYLSWVLYLSDDLHYWLREMLDEFKNIDCTKSGCMGKKCKSHPPGTHGTETTNCSCDSVVQCGGTLPLLYRHGFRYNNPLKLKDGQYYDSKESKWKKQYSYIRKCSHFASQLNNLLKTNSPLENLITSIDYFLYAIRWEFFSKLFAFWTIYVCLILYTFFFLLDTLRVRSHLKLTASHTFPPLALLTSGKPTVITKFTKLTYFMP
ncbi:variant erythrocyte surface antigen-1 family protein [Babesia caballi]|uniref:Variant erythrocyte surface antigen-1 family protein n=1 Tax=Babesia caballi TaxID=5871 RepID=A0AAV4LYR5_BABCB|nr:variant erythrocyte surface antigen-1 family protein [Babesia caballi]